MKGFKQCEKGHFYKEELDACNYCPKPNAAASSSGDKTHIVGTNSMDGGKTEVVGSGSERPSIVSESAPQRDLNKTFIQGMEAGDSGEATAKASRKIVGWLISYTLDPMGVDYRIYEGNNTVGTAVTNSIIILKDKAISGKHITILCKKGSFFLKDEMATNGTFLNGEELEIGKPYDLKDGDEIRLGAATTFTFKSAI